MPGYRPAAAEPKAFTYQARLIADPAIEAALNAYATLYSHAERCLFGAMTAYIAKAKTLGDPVEVYQPAVPYHFRIINPERPEGQETLKLIERLATSTEW